jgi:hypothetical protein
VSELGQSTQAEPFPGHLPLGFRYGRVLRRAMGVTKHPALVASTTWGLFELYGATLSVCSSFSNPASLLFTNNGSPSAHTRRDGWQWFCTPVRSVRTNSTSLLHVIPFALALALPLPALPSQLINPSPPPVLILCTVICRTLLCCPACAQCSSVLIWAKRSLPLVRYCPIMRIP